MEEFSKIYERNDWGYGSGVGSLPLNNIDYIKFVQSFITLNRLTSVVDFGCGDWQFSRFIDWSGAQYVGIDVVESVVQNNRRMFGRPNISARSGPAPMQGRHAASLERDGAQLSWRAEDEIQVSANYQR
jgi:SAM-dependent methyltransferase